VIKEKNQKNQNLDLCDDELSFCVHKVHVHFLFLFWDWFFQGFSQGNERTRSLRGQGDCCISFQNFEKEKEKGSYIIRGVVRENHSSSRRRKRKSAGNVCRATSSSLLLLSILNK
jgi:hypothetical protein